GRQGGVGLRAFCHQRGKGGGADLFAVLKQAVQFLEEVPAIVGIVLPSILAVENDGDHGALLFMLGGGREIGRVGDLFDKVAGGVAAVPLAVLETDQVGQVFIAEEQ